MQHARHKDSLSRHRNAAIPKPRRHASPGADRTRSGSRSLSSPVSGSGARLGRRPTNHWEHLPSRFDAQRSMGRCWLLGREADPKTVAARQPVHSRIQRPVGQRERLAGRCGLGFPGAGGIRAAGPGHRMAGGRRALTVRERRHQKTGLGGREGAHGAGVV